MISFMYLKVGALKQLQQPHQQQQWLKKYIDISKKNFAIIHELHAEKSVKWEMVNLYNHPGSQGNKTTFSPGVSH